MREMFHQAQENISKDENCDHHNFPIIKNWFDVDKTCEDTSCVFNTNPSGERAHENRMCRSCRTAITNMEELMSKPLNDQDYWKAVMAAVLILRNIFLSLMKHFFHLRYLHDRVFRCGVK